MPLSPTLGANVASLLASPALSKLGRCARCMRLSFGLMAGSLLLLVLLMASGAAQVLTLMSAIAAAAFTMWSAAHLVAYVLRGPERAIGCRSCAEKAKAFQREQRWRRFRARWFGKRGKLPVLNLRAPCTTCGRKTPTAEMGESRQADEALRYVPEQSPEYLRLLPRLMSPEPVDTWQADMLHYFMYELAPDAQGHMSHLLFIANWESERPLSAVIVSPDPAGGEPQTVNLLAQPVAKHAAPAAA